MTNCIGFFGVMSSGKGVMSTKFLSWANEKHPRKIISNCWLSFPGAVILSNDDLYLKHKNTDFFKNSYLYITELHTILESRSSNAIVNKNFTMFLTQIGKLDCKIIYDSQLAGQIDLRMREFTPYRFICERYVMRNNKLVSPDFFDSRKLEEQIYIKLILNVTDLAGQEQYKELGFYKPEQKDFDVFDTTEVVMLDRERYMRK